MKKISNLKRVAVVLVTLSTSASPAFAADQSVARVVHETTVLGVARSESVESVESQKRKVEELRKSFESAVTQVSEKKEALHAAQQRATRDQMKLGPRSMYTWSYFSELGRAEKEQKAAMKAYVAEQMKLQAAEASYALKDYRFLLRKKDADASISNEMRTVFSLTRAKKFAEAKALADEIAKFESELSPLDKEAGPREAIQELKGLISEVDSMKQKSEGDDRRIADLVILEKQLHADLSAKTDELAKANTEIQAQKEALAAAEAEKTSIQAKLAEAESAFLKLQTQMAEALKAKTSVEAQLAQSRAETAKALGQRDAYKNQSTWSKFRGVDPVAVAR